MVVREAAEAAADVADFDTLFAEEYPKVLRSVVLLVGDVDAAADLTQEAFVALHLHWDKVRGYDRPGAWVRKVAVRDGVRLVKKRSKHAFVALDDRHPDPKAPTAPRLEGDLRAAVLALPPGQRAAIVLHYLEDLPVREVASVLGCSEATAKVHLHRGRKRLAQLLGEEAE